VRFSVGLNTNLNHADIAKFPPQHPLNPNLNGLHWSWQGGYIFLALEGLWRNSAGELDGWAYHLARDTNRTQITVAAPLAITDEAKLNLGFDLSALLNGPCPLSFNKDGSSTHSRDGDPISAALLKNLATAFRLIADEERSKSLVTRHTSLTTHVTPFGGEGSVPLLGFQTDIAQEASGQNGPRTHQSLNWPKTFTPFPFQMSSTFPMPDLPRDNPLTVERVALGRTLFFDKQLSVNNSQSCADCHSPAKAFSDGRRASQGAEGKSGTRNAMPLFNLAWKKSFFWDGRAATLREQVLQPIQNPIEMHESLTNLVAKLQLKDQQTPAEESKIQNPKSRIDDASLFAAAFGSPEITAEKIALALENYLLTITSFDSKFDRAMRGEGTLTAQEQRGFDLFSTEYDPRRDQFGADCFHCHGGPLFQSQTFANNGLNSIDPGRYTVTKIDADKGKFAVPSLRNIELTGPYMHDGHFQTLEAVIDHYSTGIKRSATLDPNLAKHPDGGIPLSSDDKAALVAFLKTLTDPKFLTNSGAVAAAR
jgi:cytochrome c peroxidase